MGTMTGDIETALGEFVREIISDEKGSNRVEEDEISGLDEFVQERIDNTDKPDTDDINGLDDLVEDKVKDEVRSAVTDELENVLFDEVRKLFTEDNEAKGLLRDTVREVIKEMIGEAIQNLFTKRS
jgi:uncharacterized protein (DUF2267 family)